MKKRVVGGSDATTERVQDVGSEEDSTSSESSDSSASTDASDSSDSSSESSAGEQEAEPIVIGKVEGELEDGEVLLCAFRLMNWMCPCWQRNRTHQILHLIHQPECVRRNPQT
ncbi:hypothetical protein AOLI_G00043410 [Acnodon oligacanthus]